MSEFVLSLRRLYKLEKIDLSKIDSFYFIEKINKKEYDFIIK